MEELLKQIGQKALDCPTNTKESRARKGAYVDCIMMIKEALRKHDVISCVCPKEIKTGTVSIHCCNLCGKPDEDWWGKH